MGELKVRKYLKLKEFQEIFVKWSKETLERRIQDAGFPAIKDEGGGFLIPYDEAVLWFKKRKIQN